jgi:RNA polymerase sigma-70 factor (ECF subfamily)
MALGERFDGILEAARAGAPWAWERLYDDLAPLVLGYLRGRGSPDPEDTAGAVFLDMVRGFDGFTGGERDLRAWTLTIAHRRMVDQVRKRNRGLIETAVEEVPERIEPIGDVERDALDRLGVEWVRELIGGLSSDQQDVLLLRILGGLTIDEIAVTLGKRPGAVKALQRRALASIRRTFSRQGVTL